MLVCHCGGPGSIHFCTTHINKIVDGLGDVPDEGLEDDLAKEEKGATRKMDKYELYF